MIENLYPTPIYYSLVDNVEDIQKEIGTCMKKVKFFIKKDWDPSLYLSNSFEENILKTHHLKKLEKEIMKHLRNYCTALGPASLYVFEKSFENKTTRFQSWFTLCKKGNYGHIHSHGYMDISGCYYYKTNGKDGNIFFESPNKLLEASQCYYPLAERWEHQPLVGKLLLFPGWLPHGIHYNNTNNKRISLSFNIQMLQADKNK